MIPLEISAVMALRSLSEIRSRAVQAWLKALSRGGAADIESRAMNI